jgi:hypothetical protein
MSRRSRRGDHAAVAYQLNVFQPGPALQLLDLCRQSAGVACVALEHLHRDRTTVAVAEQAVDNLQPIRAVFAAIAVLSKRAAASFEIR